MLRGLYYAASSMVTQITRQDIHAGNLANVDTT
ncbi:MAG: flagellar basal-body rod protein FlgG, partial [Armatimonadetes bacterium]|nr:flagellar basal-body rod protein FlgG [Armatimonadota bacterium]